MLQIELLSTSYEIALKCIQQEANLGSGNGLVPLGSKPLPEPILTHICHHMASLGQNELMC